MREEEEGEEEVKEEEEDSEEVVSFQVELVGVIIESKVAMIGFPSPLSLA